jgi:hypothetical protein
VQIVLSSISGNTTVNISDGSDADHVGVDEVLLENKRVDEESDSCEDCDEKVDDVDSSGDTPCCTTLVDFSGDCGN